MKNTTDKLNAILDEMTTKKANKETWHTITHTVGHCEIVIDIWQDGTVWTSIYDLSATKKGKNIRSVRVTNDKEYGIEVDIHTTNKDVSQVAKKTKKYDGFKTIDLSTSGENFSDFLSIFGK